MSPGKTEGAGFGEEQNTECSKSLFLFILSSHFRASQILPLGTCWCGFSTANHVMPVSEREMPLPLIPMKPYVGEAQSSNNKVMRGSNPRSEAQDVLAPRGSEKRNLLLPSRCLGLAGLLGASRSQSHCALGLVFAVLKSS